MMTRRAATVQVSSSLWTDIETAVRSFGNLLTSAAVADASLEAMARDSDRIRHSSRHWLMG